MRKLCECGCGRLTNLADRTRPKKGHIKGQPVRFLQGHHVRTPEHQEKLNRPKGKNHHRWKGDAVGNRAIHIWVSRWKKKTGKCSTCPHRGYTEWANISGIYLRDLDDYAELCRLCHEEFDRKEVTK